MTKDLLNAPSISLGGREFKITPFVIRQARVADPLIFKILSYTKGSLQDLIINAFDEMVSLIYVAITGALPDFTKEELENLPVTHNEMMTAFSTIIDQSGLFEKNAPKGDSDTTGEEQVPALTGTN